MIIVIGSYGNKISISSSGAYVTRCFIDIKDHLGSLTLASGNIYAGQTRDMEFPDGVTWMRVRCENQRLVGKWAEVFSQESNGPRSLCYNVAGTTFHPHYSAKAC
jgi:hypothetical protein